MREKTWNSNAIIQFLTVFLVCHYTVWTCILSIVCWTGPTKEIRSQSQYDRLYCVKHSWLVCDCCTVEMKTKSMTDWTQLCIWGGIVCFTWELATSWEEMHALLGNCPPLGRKVLGNWPPLGRKLTRTYCYSLWSTINIQYINLRHLKLDFGHLIMADTGHG